MALTAQLEQALLRASLQCISRTYMPRMTRRHCAGALAAATGGRRAFSSASPPPSSATQRHRPSASALADAGFAPEVALDPAAARAQQQQQGGVAAPTYRAAIDFRFVRDNLELMQRNCEQRAAAADPARVADLYIEYVRLQQETDAVRAARNETAAAMKGKLEPEARAALIERGKALKEQLEDLDAALSAVEEELQQEGQRLPNLSHPDVPVGGEEAAAVVRMVGQQRAFDFAPKDHVTLGEDLDLIDWNAGAAVRQGGSIHVANFACRRAGQGDLRFARLAAAGRCPLPPQHARRCPHRPGPCSSGVGHQVLLPEA